MGGIRAIICSHATVKTLLNGVMVKTMHGVLLTLTPCLRYWQSPTSSIHTLAGVLQTLAVRFGEGEEQMILRLPFFGILVTTRTSSGFTLPLRHKGYNTEYDSAGA